MSQLFGPSKKPSSVTRFHMMSFRIPFTPFVRGQSLERDISAVDPVERAASTPSPVKRRDPSASFELPSFRNRNSLLRRLIDKRRNALAPKPKGDSESDRAQHGGPDEGVPKSGQP